MTPPVLAALGGPPAFREPVHVGRPNVLDPDRVLELIRGALDSRWLTNFGPLVREFEQRVAELAGARYCVATTSATSGLQALLTASELTGEVIVPSFTYVATVHVLRLAGLTPVFCDIDEDTHNLDPREVERLVTPRTSAILGVHVWGRQCAVDELAKIADRHGLKLFYDAAHAFDCGYRDRGIGGYGNAAVFSFHATKFVNAFEGGAVVTDDEELAARVRATHFFGFDAENRVIGLGINAKMTEASGAMGLTSIEGLPTLRAVNRERFGCYTEDLAEVPGVRLIVPGPGEYSSHHFVVVEVDPASGLDRDLMAKALRAENVLVRKHFDPPCHRLEPYAHQRVRRPLPATERLSSRVMQLPTGLGISAEGVHRLCELIAALVEHAPRVRARLAG
ncbi:MULTISPECIES: aminotransferase class I/II-fold pyridoxal phosphate-dependent enzyme [Amycolatopsis]|uniref:aminotransferase class I/II-fold pyridoxal phosphate-dependent enzyme n=1 Tax=Amycolatopsis sp. cg13 TaxID=3238807 RepID=UPI00352591B8